MIRFDKGYTKIALEKVKNSNSLVEKEKKLQRKEQKQ